MTFSTADGAAQFAKACRGRRVRGRPIQAKMQPPAYEETRHVASWSYADPTAIGPADQIESNATDLQVGDKSPGERWEEGREA